ncbi:MAG: hypothetical protein UC758_08840 [Ruminococcus bromii]|uniref:hypothetical protein n=2 Tax=Ruminococcus bromii TaxID=40518 RepID=UPI00265D2716|nr:hypothetical protein [Ruminococcus bromii]MEE0609695.1 hypothetical protein [Ruminococcus bromii]
MKKSIGSSKIVVDKTNNGGEKPMIYFDDIEGEFESQGFKGTQIGISPNKDKSVLFLESVRSTQTVRCPYCGGSVYIYENGHLRCK